jgi:hypothetical protein
MKLHWAWDITYRGVQNTNQIEDQPTKMCISQPKSKPDRGYVKKFHTGQTTSTKTEPEFSKK